MSSFYNFNRSVLYGVCGFMIASSLYLIADSSSSPFSSKPSSTTKPSTPPPPKKEKAPEPMRRLEKPVLPPMLKAFGMPGVIGLQGGKWEGTDYLGYLTDNIGVEVEISKGENVPNIIDEASVAKRISEIFTKENIVPRSEATEGPPLPFFHILMLVYPVDKDHYVIVGNGRLFEQIQVIRKDFIPGGFWQGITWENQDVALANAQQLDSQIQAVAEKLGTSFAKRFRQYNVPKDGMPSTQTATTPAP